MIVVVYTKFRSKESKYLHYIGQRGPSSRGLRGRMSNLLGVFKKEMPHRAPHTAAPALWVLLRTTEILMCT